jgi:hypothetical protein
VNYRYVFLDIVGQRGVAQDLRFWLVQFVDLAVLSSAYLRGGGLKSLEFALGKCVGILQAAFMRAPKAGVADR